MFIDKAVHLQQRCLRKDLSFIELRRHVYSIRNIEKYIAIKNGKLEVHNKKWDPNNVKLADKTANEDSYVIEYLQNL